MKRMVRQKNHYLRTVLLSILFLAAGAVYAQELDLTGLWQDDKGAKYYVRHMDSELFWRMDDSPRAVQVFHGVVTGVTITGEWADVPQGKREMNGILSIRIEAPDRLVLIDSDTPYAGSTWNRVEEFSEPEITSEGKPVEGGRTGGPRWEIIIEGRSTPPPPPGPTSPLDASTLAEPSKTDDTPQLQLRISDIRVEQKPIVRESPCAGFKINATFTVANIGEIPAGPEHRSLGLCFSALYYAHNKYSAEAKLKPQTGSACFITGIFFDDLAPGDSKDLTIGIPVNNMPFWIRGDLYRPSETVKGKLEIIHTFSKTFFFEGPDLRILEATITGPQGPGQVATASVVVENIGTKPTPGPVEVFITVPRKNTPPGSAANPQNRSCHWTFSLPSIPPGKNIVSGFIDVPIRGEPNWEYIHLGVYTKCPVVLEGIGWDVEIRDNFFVSNRHFVPKKALE